MRLLVTGGAGFIGSNFIKYILEEHQSWSIVNLDKLTYAGNLVTLEDIEDKENYEFVKGDITDRSLVADLFDRESFDAVVNFAAESHVDRSVFHAAPFVETNIKGTQVLLEIAKQYWQGRVNSKRFIQISTDEVYGELGEAGNFTEQSRIEPNSPYAASKASADLLCRSYHVAHGIPVLITRSSNNYGPYQFPEKLIPLMIRKALNGEKLPVYGEGEEIRDWLYVEDNVRAIDKVLRKGKPGEVYNIGGGCERKNIEVVELIRDILQESPDSKGEIPPVKFVDDPRGEAHDFRYALDTTKINNVTGWGPDTDFEEGLRKTVQWYMDNTEWINEVTSKS